jgi:hypothetical protein
MYIYIYIYVYIYVYISIYIHTHKYPPIMKERSCSMSSDPNATNAMPFPARKKGRTEGREGRRLKRGSVKGCREGGRKEEGE